MAFHAVNSPAVHHAWVSVYCGSSGYTRIPISQGKTNVTQTAKASRLAMFSKCQKSSPIQIFFPYYPWSY